MPVCCGRMSVSDAIQWLIEHESDSDVDEPLPGMADESKKAQTDSQVQ